MRRLPTDHRILNAIYERYYPTFSSYSADETGRPSKIMVPIDISDLAQDMKVDGDIIFGRLYYHMEKQYGYRKDDGKYVRFFALEAGGVQHCVNFPYIASILADLRDRRRRYRTATTISVVSLAIAIVSLAFSLFL